MGKTSGFRLAGFQDDEMSVARVMVANYTDQKTNKVYTWKKSNCLFYPQTEGDIKTVLANKKLLVLYQNAIRIAGKEHAGLITKTTGGVAVDVSNVEELD